jgi:hypothetical protein
MKKLLLCALFTLLPCAIFAKNDSNCPQGGYLRYCDGCTYNEQTKIIRCSTCPGDEGQQTHWPTSINYTSCKSNEEVIASEGTLMCNPRNTYKK